jgi:hypothetical protein
MYNETDNGSITMKQTNTKALDITVNLGEYQNIKLHSSVEREIEFSSDEDRIGLEAQMWHEICEDLTSALKNCLEDLGKESDAPAAFARTCKSKLEGRIPSGKR